MEIRSTCFSKESAENGIGGEVGFLGCGGEV